MDITIYWVLLFIFLVLSAFFASSETAFISLQRIRVKHLENSGVAGAEQVAKVIERPERLLSTVLLGNNFVNTAVATLAAIVTVSLLGEEWGILIATIGVTILLLIFGEVTPKTIAAHHAERLALLYVRPLELISKLLFPFIIALSWIASRFTQIVGEHPMPRSLLSEEEIRTAISLGEKEGVVNEAEAEMLHKVFEFGDRQVREVMTPRTDTVWVEQDTKLADFLSIYSQAPHSRFPVYEGNYDQVVGMVFIKDVLMAQAKGLSDRDSPITEIIRPVHFVPETKHIAELFTEMQSAGYQVVVVIDEYGGTAGIVTLEQLLEEIVGQLGDELARTTKEFKTIDEHTFQIDGSMRIEEANEQLDLGLPPRGL
jgi:putative hemolysin